MNELEKKIEEAAHNQIINNYFIQSEDEYSAIILALNTVESEMIDFAKSPEIKEFHTQGMWNNEEVLNLLYLAFGDKSYSHKRIKEWFENNKKKPIVNEIKNNEIVEHYISNTMNLNEINGKEIIDYLNSLSPDYNDDLYNVSVVLGSFKFRNQFIKNGQYCLEFTASYNHWGEHHEYKNNKLCITEDTVGLYLDEPFEGDGTDEILENILIKWLERHTFVDYKQVFYENTEELGQRILDLRFSDTKEMDEIIKFLIEVRSIMKEE